MNGSRCRRRRGCRPAPGSRCCADTRSRNGACARSAARFIQRLRRDAISIASTRSRRMSCGRSSFNSRDTRTRRSSSAGISASSGEHRVVVLVELADDARPRLGRQLNSACLIWFSTISRRSSTTRISVRPVREFAHAQRLQGPGHADLVKAQADRFRHRAVDAEPGQRLARLLVAFARGGDAIARVRRVDDDAVDLVGAGEGERGIGLYSFAAGGPGSSGRRASA